jgi:Zn-finger protein
MKNSYRFFNNRECKYFPCHTIQDSDNFNCLFCYCPLYFLGEGCGGKFKYSGAKSIKDCSDCYLPHIPEYYDTILSRLKEAKNNENKKKI